jgi:hypothetical protein
VKARAWTWQVAHDCRPEADKLASKNSAFPATAAAVAGGAAGVAVLVPLPPQPASAAAAVHTAAATKETLFLEFIRQFSRTSRDLLAVLQCENECYRE